MMYKKKGSKITDEKATAIFLLLKRYLPDPGLEPPEEVPNNILEILDQVYEDMLKTLDVKEGDNTQETKSRKIKYLSDLITEYFLANANESSVKEELSKKGILDIQQYSISGFDTDLFANTIAKRGIRPKHIIDAIHNPDVVQHLLPERFNADPSSPRLSLFVKEIQRKDPFLLLVQVNRDRDVFNVNSAWRIYHQDVNLIGISQPLDILRAFVEVYGLNMRVLNIPTKAKLHVYDAIPYVGDPGKFKLLDIENPDNASFEVSQYMRISDLGYVEIAIAYAVNTSRYVADLRRHRVQIG